jgi:hypothetical protein
MAKTPSSDLQRALDNMCAKDLGNGYYAFPYGRPDTFRVVKADDLSRYVALVDRYVEGETHIAIVTMPEWWSPMKRFAVKRPDGSVWGTFETARMADHELRKFCQHSSELAWAHCPIVTADLDTGEEISA